MESGVDNANTIDGQHDSISMTQSLADTINGIDKPRVRQGPGVVEPRMEISQT